MTSADRKKQLKAAWKQQEKSSLAQSIPLPHAQLRALFAHLEDTLDETPCDHTLRLTRAYLAAHALDEAAALPFFARHGGHCDCEVLNNVENAVVDIVGEREGD